MRGVIYARYSDGPRQTDQSIEGQVADCRAYAADHDIDIIGVYADRHISGTSTVGRDEFQRMMHDADRKRFDCVITWKIDRFGRNREDIAVNKMKLRKAGIQLMYAKESVPDGPEGILLESLLEGLAEYYSADLRQKILRGIRESAKKGHVTGGTLPIGYMRDSDHHVVIDPEKAEAVREVFRLYIAGASMKDLQNVLAAHGVLTNNGLPVKSIVYRMLRNRHYLGRFEIQGVEIPVEPIIDAETFAAASKRFRIRNQNAAGRATTEYALSCKCHCEKCGRLLNGMSGRGKMGTVYYYYRCPNKNCDLKSIPKDALDDAVIDATIRDVLTDDIINKLTKKIMEIQEAERKDDPAALLRQRLAAARKKQRNLIEALENGAGLYLVDRLNALDAEIEELTIEIEKAELQHPLIPEAVVRAWLYSFKNGDKSDPAFRKRLISTFVADVIVGPEYFTVYYNTNEKGPHTTHEVRAQSPHCTFSALKRTSEPIVKGSYIILSISRKK